MLFLKECNLVKSKPEQGSIYLFYWSKIENTITIADAQLLLTKAIKLDQEKNDTKLNYKAFSSVMDIIAQKIYPFMAHDKALIELTNKVQLN